MIGYEALRRDVQELQLALPQPVHHLAALFGPLAGIQVCRLDPELMQGRAVCELLLAKGAQDPDVKIFITRLGHIYNRQGRKEDMTRLIDHPNRIFETGYCIEDARLTKRLDALIYDYQRAYNKKAVEYLTRLNRAIRNRLIHRGNVDDPEEPHGDTEDEPDREERDEKAEPSDNDYDELDD